MNPFLLMIDKLIEEIERKRIKEDICIDATEENVNRIMDLVKAGVIKPTLAANPLKYGKISLYKPSITGGRVHIIVTSDKICMHWDERDPAKDPVGHLIKDTEFKYLAATLIVTLLAKLIRKIKNQKGRG